MKLSKQLEGLVRNIDVNLIMLYILYIFENWFMYDRVRCIQNMIRKNEYVFLNATIVFKIMYY